MTLGEAREKVESWRVNPKEEHNEYVDILLFLIDEISRLDGIASSTSKK